MSRAGRLFELLQILRGRRRPVSGAELAREAGVSLRTLYRDIAALQTMGAEIEGEPGVGYVLRPGFLMPPLMFSEEEIEALELGAKWVAQRTDDGLSRAARSAMAKIGAVLPQDLRTRPEHDALIVGPGWRKIQPVELKLLRRALREERKLAISYSDGKGARTRRKVWPVALGFFESARVLVAWCELRGDFRHFRTDRIETAELLDERPPRRRHALQKDWRNSMLTESDSVSAYGRRASAPAKGDSMSELVFYTNPQSRGMIVHWLLEEIGAPYRVEVEDYGTTIKAPEFLAINPMGKVPAIRHGDAIVTEAAAICAYLADAFPQAALAPPPAARDAYYRWMFFAAGCLEPAMSNHSVGWDPSADMQRRFGYGCYAAVVDTLATALAGKRYIAGDAFSAADVYVGSMIGFGMRFGALEKRPEFEAYWRGLENRPARLRAVEQNEKLASRQAWAPA
ncbi:HTH domain-containing protein [Methylosinus sp. H3A]|uniref:HTH domain-containing protein n=1 Tax=Methylosinus sp. H3A TaxID=2785786 RepID=UPI0018C2389A|nr:WYL domain-containing protein [Methylosinus sp. H3A]MBG0811810.1 HTH domain-containing protein [Methylosinus sp. H3A]